MLATPMAQKAHAFARTIGPGTYPDVVEFAHAETVHGEAAAADVAGDFLKSVISRLLAGGDAKNAGLLRGGRSQQPDQTQRRFFSHKLLSN